MNHPKESTNGWEKMDMKVYRAEQQMGFYLRWKRSEYTVSNQRERGRERKELLINMTEMHEG